MRHGVSKRHLARTPAHLLAMRRNIAQSLFQYGQVQTTLVKAKEMRPFVEKLITLARKGTLESRRRVESILTDRAILTPEEEEKYVGMTDAQRTKVMVARSGRRHRTGRVPAAYNKKKIPFVARSIVNKLVTEIAPSFKDRPGGYTRIIKLAKRRIGDDSQLAILQLVGQEEAPPTGIKKSRGVRRQKITTRMNFLEGKKDRRPRGKTARKAGASAEASEAESGGGEQA